MSLSIDAVRHWPKRVGAVVDILYADTGRVRKKYDSTTEGRSVTISPSVKVPSRALFELLAEVPALRRWDWRVQIGRNKLLSEDAALTAVKKDCEKPNVSDLCNVPGPAFASRQKEKHHTESYNTYCTEIIRNQSIHCGYL